MIKGKNQHVMPDNQGWSVIDESRLEVTQHFDSLDKAVTYAHQCACDNEGEVLIHETHCHPFSLSSVPLPQRQASTTSGDSSDWIGQSEKD